MGLPVSKGISGYLALVASYLGKFSSGTDTLEMKKREFQLLEYNSFQRGTLSFLGRFLL